MSFPLALSAKKCALSTCVVLAGLYAYCAHATSLPDATAYQDWYTASYAPGSVATFGPVGPPLWEETPSSAFYTFTGSSATGFTDVNPSTTPSVEADSTVGAFLDPNGGNPYYIYVGSIADAELDFDFEVVYIGSATPDPSVTVEGDFDFTGTGTCNAQFYANGVTESYSNGIGFGSTGDCGGPITETWTEPVGVPISASLIVETDSNGTTSQNGTATLTDLFVDPNPDYTIIFSPNMNSPSPVPEPGSIVLLATGLALAMMVGRKQLAACSQK